VRWFCSVLSGVIFYAEYAGDMNPWIYSMVYNGSFLSVDLVFLLIVMIIFYIVLSKAYKRPIK
jgi:thiamine transporter